MAKAAKKNTKRDAAGKKKRWTESRKDKAFRELFGKQVKTLAPAEVEEAAGPADLKKKPKRQPWAKGRSRKKRRLAEPRVEESGDVVLEHTFDSSEDEEEAEIKQAAKKKREEAAAAAARSRLRVHVFGIPWFVDDEALRDRFVKCGPIEALSYPRNEEGRAKGKAIFTFTSEEAVAKAVKHNETYWDARMLTVEAEPELLRKKRERIAAKIAKAKGKGKSRPTSPSSDEEGGSGDDAASGSDFGDSDDEGSDDRGGKGTGKGAKGKGKGTKGKGRSKDSAKGKGKDSAKRQADGGGRGTGDKKSRGKRKDKTKGKRRKKR